MIAVSNECADCLTFNIIVCLMSSIQIKPFVILIVYSATVYRSKYSSELKYHICMRGSKNVNFPTFFAREQIKRKDRKCEVLCGGMANNIYCMRAQGQFQNG